MAFLEGAAVAHGNRIVEAADRMKEGADAIKNGMIITAWIVVLAWKGGEILAFVRSALMEAFRKLK